MRGIAILLVLAGHFHLIDETAATVGVSLFFVLSGYLITALLLEERSLTGRIDLRRFYIRRARRLLPALVILLTALAVVAWFRGDLHRWLPGAVPVALYVGNWGYLAGVVPRDLWHTWSLAIEEQFYLVWPVLLSVLYVRGLVTLRVVVVMLILVSVVCTLPYLGSMGVGYYGSPQRAKELLAGALIAIAAFSAGRDLIIPTWVMVVAVGFLAWSAIAIFALGPVAYAMPGAIIVAWAVGHPNALAWRPLTGTGRISYGLYLYHYPLILVAAPPLVLLGVTYALATASWFLVERRFLARRSTRADSDRVADPPIAPEAQPVPVPA